MSTSLRQAIFRMEERWKESDELIGYALRETNSNKRSMLNGVSIVLQTAHFESSLKEICQAIVDDLNNYDSVRKLSKSSLSLYIRGLIGKVDMNLNSRESNDSIEKIYNWINNLKLQLDKNHFIDTEGNPKPKVVSKLAKQFGVNEIMSTLASTRIDYWLSTNSASDFDREIIRLKTYLKRQTNSYPYRVVPRTISIDENPARTSALEAQLNETMRLRNKVAHGGILGELMSDDDVRKSKIAIRAVSLYFIAILAEHVSR